MPEKEFRVTNGEFDDLFEYVHLASRTAIELQSNRDRLLYLSFGLISEVGELSGVVGKFIRGDTSVDELRVNIEKESGDILWFISMFLDFYGSRVFSNPDVGHVDKFEDFSKIFGTIGQSMLIDKVNGDIRPQISMEFLVRILALDTSCQEFIINFGKSEPQEYDLLPVVVELTELLGSLYRIVEMAGLDMKSVASTNIRKLERRYLNNTIQGDGNDR